MYLNRTDSLKLFDRWENFALLCLAYLIFILLPLHEFRRWLVYISSRLYLL